MSRKQMMVSAAILAILTWIIPPENAHADKLSDYQKQQNQLQQRTQATKNEITQLGQQEQVLQTKIHSVQFQINHLQSSIALTEADIAKRNGQMDSLKSEIARTQIELNSQYGSFEQRIRMMYEDGQAPYISVLFASTSFSDLIDRIQMLSLITNQNKLIIQSIARSKQKLDTANQALAQQQVTQEAVYRTLQSKQTAAKSAEQMQLQLWSQVHSNRLRQQAELQGEDDALANLKSIISQLIAEEGQYTGSASGWTWPVPNAHNISSGYGWRTWSDGSREFHDGVDIAAPIGTPIVAATSGKVLYAGPASGFGDWIVMQSFGGLLEVYGHMYDWEIKVSPGQVVGEGQQIAAVGSNGFSTGPHLHFTVATGFDSSGFLISQNPLQYIHP